MILIVGYGNLTRQDDGLGVRLAEALEQENLPNIEVRTSQQMHLELLEDLGAFDRILLADATAMDAPLEICQVTEDSGSTMPSSHALNPSTLLKLSQKLYGQKLSLFMLAIPGQHFDFGMELSPMAQRNLEDALSLTKSWLK